ncbi:MAG TPA: sialidase family protein [Chitinophagaceae bacterium]
MKWCLVPAVLSVMLMGCGSLAENTEAPAAKSILLDSMPGQCPFLTMDHLGRMVISWAGMTSDSTARFCYATADDAGVFGKPVVVPGSEQIKPNGENLPRIIFKPSGEIIALWGVANPNELNKYSGLVYYSQSFDQGKTWSPPAPLVHDTASFDQRYYDVALLPDGEVGIIWLDNRQQQETDGSALYFASSEGRDGFKNERRISEPCCPCCRTDLFVDSKGRIHAIYRAILQDTIRDMVHLVSADNGRSFTKPRRISFDNWVLRGCPHTGPSMTENSSGIHFSWYTGGGAKGAHFTSSRDNGQHFDMPDTVSSSGSHPQLITLGDDRLLVAWDEYLPHDTNGGKRIGLQWRDVNGKRSDTRYVAEGLDASYPVLIASGKSGAVLAYTSKKNRQPEIYYQYVGRPD